MTGEPQRLESEDPQAFRGRAGERLVDGLARADAIGQASRDGVGADEDGACPNDSSTVLRSTPRLRATPSTNTSVIASITACRSARPSASKGLGALRGDCVDTMPSVRIPCASSRALRSTKRAITPIEPTSAVSLTTTSSAALAIQYAADAPRCETKAVIGFFPRDS